MQLNSTDSYAAINQKQVSEQQPNILDRLRENLRSRHYSHRTEQTYSQWITRFICFHNGRYPDEMVLSIKKAVKQAVYKSDISKRATCHTFRHSFATPFAWRRLWHTYYSRIAWTQGCSNNHDLYTCSESRRKRCSESYRHPLNQKVVCVLYSNEELYKPQSQRRHMAM